MIVPTQFRIMTSERLRYIKFNVKREITILNHIYTDEHQIALIVKHRKKKTEISLFVSSRLKLRLTMECKKAIISDECVVQLICPQDITEVAEV